LYDPYRAIVATEDATEDDHLVDSTSSKKWPIPFLLGPNKRPKPSGDNTIDIVSKQKGIKTTKDCYLKLRYWWCLMIGCCLQMQPFVTKETVVSGFIERSR
jgi:hypothetical protein